MFIANQLQQALALWIELTGVDPSTNSFTLSLGGGLDGYTVKQMHKTIQEALELDPSNITGHLLLDAVSTRYFIQRSFSIADLVADPVRTSAYVTKVAEFMALVRSPEIAALSEAFAQALQEALHHYGVVNEKTLSLINDRHRLAYLRRDALRSLETLRVDQFLKGGFEAEGVKPVYNPIIHQFWNVNSLIQAACHQPSGITLNLVRDPDDLQSYFAFAIRNGGNLYLLSDVPVHAHPLQKYMSRRPERAFGERTYRNWFPYDLLNLKFDEESKQIFADETKRCALIPFQQKIDRLKPIVDLSPEETIWITMMFDLIIQRFWDCKHQVESLSYTGGMIKEERPLIEEAARANLPVPCYPCLNLPTLAVDDIRHGTVDTAAFGSDGGAPNRWLEERYLDRVEADVLNLIDGTGNKHYLLPHSLFTDGLGDHKNHDQAIFTGNVVSVSPALDKEIPDWHKSGRYQLHPLDATSFGRREELEHNRLFMARYNAAKAIQRLADEEYAARKADIEAWWKQALEKNRKYLFSMIAQQRVTRTLDTVKYPTLEITVSNDHRSDEYDLLYVVSKDDRNGGARWLSSGTVFHQGYRQRGNVYLCWLHGTASSWQALFQPQTAEDLAELAGCALSELPDVLQHWCINRNYEGNHLLDRIDPMAWALRDPWQKMRFRVLIHLSARAMNDICKNK